jgi:tripartite-type tricarboxylate transporter receptor subunit TctC
MSAFKRRLRQLAAMASFIALAPQSASAQQASEYPARPIRFIVPVAPGGGNDITARAIAQKLTQAWGQQVIVDNRAGASGAIAFDLTVKAVPDGYTLLMIAASHPINTVALPSWPYDVAKDVSPVSLSTSLSYVVYTHPSVPFSTFKELIAYGRKYPGKLNYGTPGTASLQHLGWELIGHSTGAKFTHVPYKGGAPAIQATIGGEMQIGFITVISLRPHLASGRARALAVTSRTRMPAMPELPAIAELGLPGFELNQWYGVVTTAKVPAAIVNKLSAGIAEAVKSPDVAQRLAADGSTPVGSSAAEFGAVIQNETAKWRKVIKETGVVLN